MILSASNLYPEPINSTLFLLSAFWSAPITLKQPRVSAVRLSSSRKPTIESTQTGCAHRENSKKVSTIELLLPKRKSGAHGYYCILARRFPHEPRPPTSTTSSEPV